MYIESLQEFLSKYFPGLILIRNCDFDKVEVLLPEDPGRIAAEKAVDEAFERNQ